METSMPMDPKDEKIDGYDKYEIENACETLLKAETIKQDEKLMKALGPYLDKKVKAAMSLKDHAQVDPKEGMAGLRKVASKKIEENAKKY